MLLVAMALSTHPQGDVARVAPYGIASGALWVAMIGVLAGRRAAVTTLGTLSALTALAVLVYVIWIEPIPYDECGTLSQELGRRSCRDRASTGIIAVAAAGALASLILVRVETWPDAVTEAPFDRMAAEEAVRVAESIPSILRG